MNSSLIKICTILAGCAFLASCAALKETARYEFVDDEYWYRQRGNEYVKVYVDADLQNDIIEIYPLDPEQEGALPTVVENKDQYL